MLPIKIHGVVAIEHSAHVFLHHFHVHHIIIGAQGVANTKLCTIGKIQCHQHTGIRFLHWSEIEVLRVVALGAGVEHKAIFIFSRRKHFHLVAESGVLGFVGGFIGGQCGTRNHCPLARNHNLERVVFQHHRIGARLHHSREVAIARVGIVEFADSHSKCLRNFSCFHIGNAIHLAIVAEGGFHFAIHQCHLKLLVGKASRIAAILL